MKEKDQYPHIILGNLGHVDSGKTTLLSAILFVLLTKGLTKPEK